MDDTLKLAQALIARPSVTPDDQGCQSLIAEYLQPYAFVCESITANGVTNLWARRGTQAPLIVFAGHTDVVPAGPLAQWSFDPFTPTIHEGKLYGRGAADMKTPLAAMIVAACQFIARNPKHPGSIAFLITSDEEGIAIDGTARVCQLLKQRGEIPDYCIVGEPSSVKQLGDTIKIGRRGSLSATLSIQGEQGHIAYPQRYLNPVHAALPALAELASTQWDGANEDYEPTTWQISNIQAGTGADNVIPGQLDICFNFRFSTASSVDSLKERVCAILDKHGLRYTLNWRLGGQPFLTPQGTLCQAVCQAIEAETGIVPERSTSGGTSDGRFIAQICPEVIEFGSINASIHQIDEHVAIADLDTLTAIYRRTLEHILFPQE